MTSQEKLLRILADGELHSEEDLSKALDISRASIQREIIDFSDFGISVISQPGKNYQLIQKLDFLSDSEILSSINPSIREALIDINVLWSIESTNDYLFKFRAPDKGRFGVCIAEYQTMGKGRKGRKWRSSFGQGICLSISWNFSSNPPNLSALGLAVGVGLTRALRRSGVKKIQLKWPNDILVLGRKLAGILIDLQGEASGRSRAVVGIGINYIINSAITQEVLADNGLEPISMNCPEVSINLQRNKIIAVVIEEIYNVLIEFSVTGFESFMDEWKSADFLFGKQVTVETESVSLIGTVSGISSGGALKITTSNGAHQVFNGDVSVRAIL